MRQYDLNEFSEDIAHFNSACGVKSYDTEDSLEDVCKGVLRQYNIIQEEVEELKHAAETLDEVSLKDAVVDVLFTSLRLVSLLEGRYNIMAGCHAVAENNALKYSDDDGLVNEWKKQKELKGIECEVVGTVLTEPNGWHEHYFCIKNKNGKVLKYENFPKVDLSVMDKV